VTNEVSDEETARLGCLGAVTGVGCAVLGFALAVPLMIAVALLGWVFLD